jgi:hypothetical protein
VRSWISRILTIVLILIGGALVLNWEFNRPPVHMNKLKAIRQGSSREEVRAALGSPTSSYEADRKWAYSRSIGWSIVYVYFDEQGRFEKYEYDY